MSVYYFDSNFFITCWNMYYSPDVIPSFWDFLINEAKIGKAKIPEEIFEELSVGGDSLFDWIKNNKKFFICKMDEKVEEHLQTVMMDNDVQNLIDNKNRLSQYDPILFAYGKIKDSIIVSDDRRINDICKKLKINCMHIHEYIKANVKMQVI